MVLLMLCGVLALLALGFRAAWRATGPDVPGSRRSAEAAELWRRRELERTRRADRARRRRLPPLPADDAPPPGLTPLAPTPRVVRTEVARGIRELEDWLADQAAA